MLTTEQQKFLHFCFSKGYINKKQINTLQNNIKMQPKLPFSHLLAQTLSCNLLQIEKLQAFYQAEIAHATNENDITIPTDLLADFHFAQEIFGRGLISLQKINQCFSEKQKSQEQRNILQLLLAKRLLSSKNFLLVQKSKDPKKWINAPSELEIRSKGSIYHLEKKSTAKNIGNYKIIGELGRGGMGIVYEGYDSKLDRTVAIKTMISHHASQAQKERFMREAKLVASLKHPGIPQIYEIGREKEVTFFVMDYIEGLSLSDYIKTTKLNLNAKITLLLQVVEALGFAHEKGIIHRDIKPDNVLIDAEGKPFLMDFGLAKQKGNQGLTASGTPLGTPRFMSPEQVEGKSNRVEATTDIYSIGVILYQILTERPPFTASSLQEIFSAITSKNPIPPKKLVPDLPRDIETICLKCLEKIPNKRYLTAKALADDLENFLRGNDIKAKPIGVIAQTNRWIKRNKLLCGFALLLVTSLCFFSYRFIFAPGILTLTIQGQYEQKWKTISPSLFVDNHYVPKQKKHVLSSGYRRIELKLIGYKPLKFTVKIRPGEEIKLERQMLRIKKQVTFTSAISNINVSCIHLKTSEKFSFLAPVYNYLLPTGKYRFLFEKDNHFSQKKELLIDNKTKFAINLRSMFVWYKEYPDKISDLAVNDLDMDGSPELYVTQNSGQISSYDLVSKKELWKHDLKINDNRGNISFHDVDHDGFLDIIYSHYEQFSIINGKTKEISFTRPSSWGGGFTFYDSSYPKDGYDDVVFVNKYRPLLSVDYKTQTIQWQKTSEHTSYATHSSRLPHFDEKTIIYQDTRFRFHLFNLLYQKQSGEIFTTRGRASCQVTSQQGKKNIFFIEEQKLTTFDSSLIKTWDFSYKNNRSRTILFSDLDQDGETEILVPADRLYCLKMDGSAKWSFEYHQEALHIYSPIVADLNKDGKKEIVLRADNLIYILDLSGKEISKLHFEIPITDLNVSDVTGDGFLEVLCVSHKKIYAMQPMQSLKKTYKDDYFLVADRDTKIIADVNNDGISDVIIANALGKLYCLDGKNFEIIWQKKYVKRPYLHIYTTESIKELYVFIENGFFILDLKGKEKKYVDLTDYSYTYTENIQIEDLDGDSSPEIFFNTQENVYCYSLKDQNQLWKTKALSRFGQYSFIDANGDNVKDCIILMEGRNLVYCFSGKNGSILWNNAVAQSGDRYLGTKIVHHEGNAYLFICQLAGEICRIDYRTGNIIWKQKFPAGAFINEIIVGNFDDSQGIEMIAFADTTEVLCLDIETGNQKWMNLLHKNFHNRKIVIVPLDIDEDGSDEVITTSITSQFTIINLKTGEWRWSTAESRIAGQPIISNTNGQLDLFYISNNSELIKITDLKKYLKRSFLPSTVESIKNDKSYSYFKASYNNFYQKILAFEEKKVEANFSWRFQKVLGYISQKKYDKANTYLKKYLSQNPASFKGKFIEIILLLAKKDVAQKKDAQKKALKLIVNLMGISIWDFDQCLQQYKNLMTLRILRYFNIHILKGIKQNKYYEKLPRAYENAIFLKDLKQQKKLLSISLKYSLPNLDLGYELRKKQYIKQIIKKSNQHVSLYRKHKAYQPLENALKIIPNDPEILMKVGLVALERRNYKKAYKTYNNMNGKNKITGLAGQIVSLGLLENQNLANTILLKGKKYFVTKQDEVAYKLLEAIINKDFRKASLLKQRIPNEVKKWYFLPYTKF